MNAIHNATIAFDEGVIVVRMTREYIKHVRDLQLPENALLLLDNATELINGTGDLVLKAYEFVSSASATMILYREVGQKIADFVDVVQPFVLVCGVLLVLASIASCLLLGGLLYRAAPRASAPTYRKH